MVLIPSGEYTMGAPDGAAEDLLPLQRSVRRTARLEAYEIGRYEITNAEYAAFIRDGGYQNRSYWSDEGWTAKERLGRRYPEAWMDRRYWQTRLRDVENDRNPVVGVSWYEARAYCRWLSAKAGFRFDLPTEGQWEAAARGTQNFLFPWGDRWDPERCNCGDDTDGNGQGDGGIDGYSLTAPVGTYPAGASPFGCYDMAGNVYEWCLNRFEEEGSGAAYRVLRGGSLADCLAPQPHHDTSGWNRTLGAICSLGDDWVSDCADGRINPSFQGWKKRNRLSFV
ncbi:MAG: SUMF1/EgtB/PvdO family nonheme iron enzyme [bacterium]